MKKRKNGEIEIRTLIGLILLALVILAVIIAFYRFELAEKLGILPDFNVTEPSDITCLYDDCALIGGRCVTETTITNNSNMITIGIGKEMNCNNNEICVIEKTKEKNGELEIKTYTKQEFNYQFETNDRPFVEMVSVKELAEPIPVVPGVQGTEKIDIRITYPGKEFCYMLKNDNSSRGIIEGQVRNVYEISREILLTNTPNAKTLTLIAWDPYERIGVSIGKTIEVYDLTEYSLNINIEGKEELIKILSVIPQETFGNFMYLETGASKNKGKELHLIQTVPTEFSSLFDPSLPITTWQANWALVVIPEGEKFGPEAIYKFYVLVPQNDENYKAFGANVSKTRWVEVLEIDQEEMTEYFSKKNNQKTFEEFLKEKLGDGRIYINGRFK